jgi:hypothetical protein
MLFACSGIPIPEGRTQLCLMRFVTSKFLVDAFKKNRYKDDNLRVGDAKPSLLHFV